MDRREQSPRHAIGNDTCQEWERRERGERRRSAAGLFEVRARREGIGGDRRRSRVGAATRRRLRAIWRRVRP
jgi:hypothetical protein